MVLSAPLLALAYGTPRLLAQVTGFLMHFGLGEAFSPGAGGALMQTQPFASNPLTSDPGPAISARSPSSTRTRRSGWAAQRSAGSTRRCAPACASPTRFRRDRADAGADRPWRRGPMVSNLAAEIFTPGEVGGAFGIPGAQHNSYRKGSVPRPVLGGVRRLRRGAGLGGHPFSGFLHIIILIMKFRLRFVRGSINCALRYLVSQPLGRFLPRLGPRANAALFFAPAISIDACIPSGVPWSPAPELEAKPPSLFLRADVRL